MRCPTCDGAMVTTGREPRCVRCGVAPVKAATFPELLALHKPKMRAKKYGWESQAVWLGDDHYVAVLSGTGGGVCLVRRGAESGEPGLLLPIDLARPVADQAYWNDRREEVYALFPGRTDCGRLFWKQIRQAMFVRQVKGWRQALPAGIVAWADEVLDQMSNDYECADNWRVARLGSTPQMRRYQRQVAKGCCGSKDFRLIGPDQRQYTLGFNYGH